MKVQKWCRRIPAIGTALLAFDCSRVVAQEALGEAVAVDQSRRARKQAIERNDYNYKAGPVMLRFDALMGFEFNDNPNLLDKPKEVDFAFHPELDVAALWPISHLNALSFNFGVGYMKYVNNDQLDHVLVTPNTELAVDIYSGDFTFNVHERVSYTQNPASDPSVSRTGDFGGIDNTAGVRVDWDLNHVLLSAGYDHVNFVSMGGSALSEVQDSSAEMFYTRGGMLLGPNLRVGLEIAGGFTDYSQNVFADNSEFSAGPYVEVELTKQLRLRARGGYVRYDFDTPQLNLSITNITPKVPQMVDDFYGDITVEHQLNQRMAHSLSLGHEARSGAASELMTMWYVRYGNDWSLSQYLTLHTKVFYENGRDEAGFNGDKFWRVGFGAGVAVPITRQLTGTVSYELLYKDSNQANNDYLQNLVAVEFKYRF